MTDTVDHASERPVVRANPYVGPRSYRPSERLYGRDHELNELRDVLIAERIVLLYSPSGAGKSSLLEAGLRAELEDRDFDVLPTIRVGHDVPPTIGDTIVRNRYTMSALLSLEEGRDAKRQLEGATLAGMRFQDYLAHLAEQASGELDLCLFFDQFEELFTLDPTDQDVKADFLEDLGTALRDRHWWAVFAMREDFIAQLDPLASLIPKRFSCRFRLDLLEPPAALEATIRPAAGEGIDLTVEAADHLIDDLRRVRVQRGPTVTEELGRYVEPVQLQVVCRQLWESVAPTWNGNSGRIDIDDVAAVGNVDDALADYYESAVTAAALSTGVSERAVREWFETVLVSEHGFRTQTIGGPGGGRSADVLRELEAAHVIRADARRGTQWYELSHDRLVAPLRTSNADWRARNLTAVQVEAANWETQSRPRGLLITGDALDTAVRWATHHQGDLTPIEQEFLDACRDEQQRLGRELRAIRRTRRLAVLSTLLAAAAIIGLVVALNAWRNARDDRATARAATAEAQQQALAASSASQAAADSNQALEAASKSLIKATDTAEQAQAIAEDKANEAESSAANAKAALARVQQTHQSMLLVIKQTAALATDAFNKVGGVQVQRIGIDATPAEGCSAASETPSVTDGAAINRAIYVNNLTGEPIDVSWVSPSGDHFPWETIDTSGSITLPPISGWSFVVTDRTGRCLRTLQTGAESP